MTDMLIVCNNLKDLSVKGEGSANGEERNIDYVLSCFINTIPVNVNTQATWTNVSGTGLSPSNSDLWILKLAIRIMGTLSRNKMCKCRHFCVTIMDTTLLKKVYKSENKSDGMQPGLHYYGFSTTKTVENVCGDTNFGVIRFNMVYLSWAGLLNMFATLTSIHYYGQIALWMIFLGQRCLCQ